MKTEAEFGGALPQIKEFQIPQKPEEAKKFPPPLEALEEACEHDDFKFLFSIIMREEYLLF